MTGYHSKRAAALDEDGMYLMHRLIRIMGTFDLATGHADTFDELLDSLESELRDVLGYYREALAQLAQEPVASCNGMPAYEGPLSKASTQERIMDDDDTQVYQRPWVGLTDEDCKGMSAGDKVVAMWAEAKLKNKNA